MNDKKIMKEILFLQNISHVYNQEDQKIKVLNNINLKVFKGEMLALTGPSGTGKSTLLNIAGLLETPTFGFVNLAGKNCRDMKEDDKSFLQNKESIVKALDSIMRRVGAVKTGEIVNPEFYDFGLSYLEKFDQRYREKLPSSPGVSITQPNVKISFDKIPEQYKKLFDLIFEGANTMEQRIEKFKQISKFFAMPKEQFKKAAKAMKTTEFMQNILFMDFKNKL